MELARDAEGRWRLAVEREGFGYGAAGRVRELLRLRVPRDATLDEAKEAAREELRRRGIEKG